MEVGFWTKIVFIVLYFSTAQEERPATMYGDRFVLRATLSHVSIPPNQNGTMAKDGEMRRENVLRKIQPSERYYVVAFVFRHATRLNE